MTLPTAVLGKGHRRARKTLGAYNLTLSIHVNTDLNACATSTRRYECLA